MFETIGAALDAAAVTALKPATEMTSVVDGLTEGELRVKAVAELGTEIADAMPVDDLIDWYIQE